MNGLEWVKLNSCIVVRLYFDLLTTKYSIHFVPQRTESIHPAQKSHLTSSKSTTYKMDINCSSYLIIENRAI